MDNENVEDTSRAPSYLCACETWEMHANALTCLRHHSPKWQPPANVESATVLVLARQPPANIESATVFALANLFYRTKDNFFSLHVIHAIDMNFLAFMAWLVVGMFPYMCLTSVVSHMMCFNVCIFAQIGFITRGPYACIVLHVFLHFIYLLWCWTLSQACLNVATNNASLFALWVPCNMFASLQVCWPVCRLACWSC